MKELPKGGGFLFGDTDPMSIFTVEDFNDEHKMIYRTASGFMDEKILPRLEEWDNDKNFNKQVAKELGDLGMLGIDAPEEFGGTAMDKISTTIVAEVMGRSGSMCMLYDGQTGIGQLPLVFFGTNEQRAKYLPGVVAGDNVIAYALTEPGAGSDALAATTWARLSEDGKYYILNGTKQFITNAGFAEYYIVFAKIDRKDFTCFIVDANTEGLSTGPEEHKMGLKGSSTRTVILEDVKVPVENILFEIGKGHVVAFNILSMGRYKIAANSIGMGKLALEMSAQYANDRKQFGKPIAEFGLIKEKLANMAARIYALESMVYRTGGMIEDIMHIQPSYPVLVGQDSANAIEEYNIECSMGKVFGTEVVQGYCTDEGLQIHGGYGYTADYPIERLYRDCRVFRIFEGTNEINRTIIGGHLIRRGLKGTLPLQKGIDDVKAQIGQVGLRKDESELVQAAKDITLFSVGAALEKYGKEVLGEQQIIAKIADMFMYTFVMESAWLRTRKAEITLGADQNQLRKALTSLFIYDFMDSILHWSKEVLGMVYTGNDLSEKYSQLQSLAQFIPGNTIALRQQVATAVSNAGGYVL